MNFFAKAFSKVAELFSDDCGRLSSMRVTTFVLVITGVYFFWRIIDVWSTICLAKTEFVPLNLTDFTGLIGAVAALFAKSWQKKIESQYDSCNRFTFSADEVLDPEPSSPEDPMPTTPTPPTNAPRRRPAGLPPEQPEEGEDR